ncbi:SDR family oxidoreductase [Paenibacillus sp. J5C_2022]|uniref:dTDP-4-dehydrorhamnose reductase family protein n=1 Tax=Paenibacillus sp. J5C2022 TaxID=2977129 RepID=UPI0021D0D515|nr:SDR family oxidoreductase [Paenibacillus sp. J5C2022]MCU6710423.1 SDR family oxidoreductase [Paenibacillus sp. J5C2022]
MKKIVVLGGGGMAGHVLRLFLASRGHEVYYTQRSGKEEEAIPLDLRDFEGGRTVLERLKPDVVINAAGLLNDAASNRLQEAILVNSLLPHRLADWGDELNYRLLHISTDCVFSGIGGPYEESRVQDGSSVYAKTKSLGEVNRPGHLTIRTSIIGPELHDRGIGLFHWFMSQTGEVQGYSRVYWNGVTTLELARFAIWCVESSAALDGVIHLASGSKVSKDELLRMMNRIFRVKGEVTIRSCDKLHHDKSLLGTRSDCSYEVPSYDKMLRMQLDWMQQHPRLYRHYRLAADFV